MTELDWRHMAQTYDKPSGAQMRFDDNEHDWMLEIDCGAAKLYCAKPGCVEGPGSDRPGTVSDDTEGINGKFRVNVERLFTPASAQPDWYPYDEETYEVAPKMEEKS